MIRAFENNDMEAVLTIWLTASIEAHDFIEAAYWQEKLVDMRTVYIPGSTTTVFEDKTGTVVGFLSLVDNYVAALFVAPAAQGQGVGRQLMENVKRQYANLQLGVYSKNVKSIGFYKKQGFIILREQEEPHTEEMETIMEFNHG